MDLFTIIYAIGKMIASSGNPTAKKVMGGIDSEIANTKGKMDRAVTDAQYQQQRYARDNVSIDELREIACDESRSTGERYGAKAEIQRRRTGTNPLLR